MPFPNPPQVQRILLGRSSPQPSAHKGLADIQSTLPFALFLLFFAREQIVIQKHQEQISGIVALHNNHLSFCYQNKKKAASCVWHREAAFWWSLWGFCGLVFAIKKEPPFVGGSKIAENYFSCFCDNVLALIDGNMKLFGERLKKDAVNEPPADDLSVPLSIHTAVDVVDVFVDHFVDVGF